LRQDALSRHRLYAPVEDDFESKLVIRLKYVLARMSPPPGWRNLKTRGRPSQKRDGRPMVFGWRSMTVIAILREHWGTTLRETCSLVGRSDWLMQTMGLTKAPSKSTLQSTSKRLPVWWLHRVNRMLISEPRKPGRPRKLCPAVDSSGLRSHGRSAWFSLVLGKESRRDFRKMHLAVECRMNARFVYAWVLTEGSEADSPVFTELLEETVSHGHLGYVCADSAYASRANAQLTEDLGGTPIIRPKANHTPKPAGSPAWKRMVSYAISRPKSFGRRYHRRWMCETVNSVIKRKWGETLKNRTLPSQARELGFRILLHNARERLKKDILA